MRKDANLDVNALRVDGGMTHNSMLMQFQSDLENVRIVCPKQSETTALGIVFHDGVILFKLDYYFKVLAKFRSKVAQINGNFRAILNNVTF